MWEDSWNESIYRYAQAWTVADVEQTLEDVIRKWTADQAAKNHEKSLKD
jgi:hypothetical protein